MDKTFELVPCGNRQWTVIERRGDDYERHWGKVSAPPGDEPFFLPLPGAMVFPAEALEAIARLVRLRKVSPESCDCLGTWEDSGNLGRTCGQCGRVGRRCLTCGKVYGDGREPHALARCVECSAAAIKAAGL